jgi:glycosyltransferase involved in cell wall biosynthesis
VSGVPRYASTLARALDDVAGEFPELRLTLLTTAAGERAVGARNLEVQVPNVGSRVREGPLRIALEQVAAARARADLLHFFDLTGPVLAPRRPFFATAHDASVVRGLRPARGAYKRRLWPWALTRARRVIAVSEFTKSEIVSCFSVPPANVAVVHSGPGMAPVASSVGESPVRQPYFLYVGTVEPLKNLAFLVRAFARSSVDARLVVAGRAVAGEDALREAIRETRSSDRVILVGPPDDHELEALYRNALAVVLPSLYEGFGFTPLEAMGRDRPVLASDIPALREISGAGALLLPVDDEQAWAEGLRNVANDASLRASLVDAGRKTVARYSWANTARELCRVFSEAAAPR